MALATQCPHCQTTFRVVQDQLKLRAGLVRCGNCKEIFNGIENLLRPDGSSRAAAAAAAKTVPIPTDTSAPGRADALPAASAALESAKPGPIEFAAPLASPDMAPAPAAPTIQVPAAATTAASPRPTDSASAATPATPATPAEPPPAITDFFDLIKKPAATVPEPIAAKLVAVEVAKDHDPLNPVTLMAFPEDLPSADELPMPESHARSDTIAPLGLQTESLIESTSEEMPDPLDAAVEKLQRMPLSEAEEPSFVTFERRRQRNARIVRVLTRAGSAILLVSAILQGAYLFRNQIAAHFPQLKPLMAQACSAVGCVLGLPMQIDATTIESDGPHPLATSKDGFEFTALLRNYSQTAQAWPHIELILKDADGKMVVRRVFAPAEYLASRDELPKGIPAKSEHAAKLFFELAQVKVARYEVDRFYP
ncbi:hypothetical protein BH11PSE11_BH11PSE11_01220 [soil metagenome]